MLHICLLGLLRILDRFQQAARFSPVAVCPSLIHFSLDPVKQCGALHKCREHGLYFGSCPTFGHKILRPHRGCNIIPAYLSKLFWEELQTHPCVWICPIHRVPTAIELNIVPKAQRAPKKRASSDIPVTGDTCATRDICLVSLKIHACRYQS